MGREMESPIEAPEKDASLPAPAWERALQRLAPAGSLTW